MVILLKEEYKQQYLKAMDEVNSYLKKMDERLAPSMKKKISVYKVISSKARSRHACVNRTNHVLNISEHMFTEATEKELVQTLLHEMCHMYERAGHGHGYYWKFYADLASEVSGLKITRCSNIGSYSEERDERRKKLVEKSGLRFKCNDCGVVLERTRRSNFTEHFDRYTCARCGGHFSKI